MNPSRSSSAVSSTHAQLPDAPQALRRALQGEPPVPADAEAFSARVLGALDAQELRQAPALPPPRSVLRGPWAAVAQACAMALVASVLMLLWEPGGALQATPGLTPDSLFNATFDATLDAALETALVSLSLGALLLWWALPQGRGSAWR